MSLRTFDVLFKAGIDGTGDHQLFRFRVQRDDHDVELDQLLVSSLLPMRIRECGDPFL